jgi:hypothetical protein
VAYDIFIFNITATKEQSCEPCQAAQAGQEWRTDASSCVDCEQIIPGSRIVNRSSQAGSRIIQF